jgi:probable rRNA maturation factor
MSRRARRNPDRHQIEVQWGLARAVGFPDDASIRRWVCAVLEYVRSPAISICIRWMSVAEIAGLNSRYRDKEGGTNVLSFPCEGEIVNGRQLMGDLALCASVIQNEAAEQSKTLESHVAHMVIHGTLHLAGYDHVDVVDAKEMEAIEVELMADFGFSDPYEGEEGVRIGT